MNSQTEQTQKVNKVLLYALRYVLIIGVIINAYLFSPQTFGHSNLVTVNMPNVRKPTHRTAEHPTVNITIHENASCGRSIEEY